MKAWVIVSFQALNLEDKRTSIFTTALVELPLSPYVQLRCRNRHVTANINGTTSTYTYDGLRQRVMRVSGGTTSIDVYDALGKLDASIPRSPLPARAETPLAAGQDGQISAYQYLAGDGQSLGLTAP